MDNTSSSGLVGAKNVKVGLSYKMPNDEISSNKGCYKVTRKTKVTRSNKSNLPRYNIQLIKSGKKRSFMPYNINNKLFKKCRARTLKKKAK